MKPVVTLGECMGLFRANSMGSTVQVSDFTLGVGGAESNVAVALARLGLPVRWVGRVGADSIGSRVLRELRAEGIDVIGLIDPAAPTGIMVKERRTVDITRIQYYRSGSAGSRLTADDVAVADIENAALLHVTGITPALSNSAHEAVLRAIAIAHSAGVPVSFDVNHRTTLWADHPGAIYRDLASRADILFTGEDEARFLFPDSTFPAQLAEEIASLGPTQVLIKLGDAGCVALVDGTHYSQAAVPITAIDTVGAGDAFVAGYLADLLSGHPVERRLTTAVTLGAFACLNPGDWEGYPSREELALLSASEPVQR